MFIFFIATVVVKFTIPELLDYLTLYIQSPQGTISHLPGWMESQWLEGGPRDETSGYLTFSLTLYLLILLGDIELNPGPKTVKY